MSDSMDLGSLVLTQTGADLVFTFPRTAGAFAGDTPDCEQHLREQLSALLASARDPLQARMDLQHTPAISSRQLGVLLALHKVLRPRLTPLPLANVSENVKRLLKMTRTEQFFEVRP